MKDNSYKILEIKKRPFLVRVFSIYGWRVKVLYKGERFSLNCWAGIHKFDENKLLWSIRQELQKVDKNKLELDVRLKKMTNSEHLLNPFL